MKDAGRLLNDEMTHRAGALADFLVTQPHRREALKAARDFGFWCLQEGARLALESADKVLAADGETTEGADHAEDV